MLTEFSDCSLYELKCTSLDTEKVLYMYKKGTVSVQVSKTL